MAKGSCVQQEHTADCINVSTEPTPLEERNKKAVDAVYCVFTVGSFRVLLISCDEVGGVHIVFSF